jgi:hypothetical protein
MQKWSYETHYQRASRLERARNALQRENAVLTAKVAYYERDEENILVCVQRERDALQRERDVLRDGLQKALGTGGGAWWPIDVTQIQRLLKAADKARNEHTD